MHFLSGGLDRGSVCGEVPEFLYASGYRVFVEVSDAGPYDLFPSLLDRHSQDPEHGEAVGLAAGADEEPGRVRLVLEVVDVAVIRGVAKHDVPQLRDAFGRPAFGFAPPRGLDGFPSIFLAARSKMVSRCPLIVTTAQQRFDE